MAITRTQMARLQRRKTSDIDRLAAQYKKNVESMTGEYQSSFGEYQKQVATQMAPFEEQMSGYKSAFSEYEKQQEAYRQRLDDFQARLTDVEKNPTEMVNASRVTIGRGQTGYNIGGRVYSEYTLPDEYFIKDVPTGATRTSRGVTTQVTEKRLFRNREVPTFTEKAPTAPTAPEAPQVAAFDTAPFEQKRTQLQQEFTREVGERKSGRLAAVSQRSRRSMLQGA